MSSLRRLQTAPREEIVFFNVQKCYEKVQCRKNKKSKQRVQGATINLRVTTDAPISRVEVFVERLPKAAVLCGDSNGRVPLKTKLENLMYSDVSSFSSSCSLYFIPVPVWSSNPVAFFTVHYDLYPLFLSDLEVLFFMYHLLFRCLITDTACLSYKPRKYETCILIKSYRQFS